MKLLEALDSMQSEADSVRESLRISLPDAVREAQNPGPYRRFRGNAPTGQYLKALTECAKLITNVRKGITPAYRLQEAMTSDDFPLLFGDLSYKQLLGFYQTWESTYPAISAPFQLNDFKSLNLYTMDGGATELDTVKEEGPYPETKFTEGRYQLVVTKFGRRYGLSFELIINDDMNAFQSRPAQLAVGARRTEEKAVTRLYVDVNGPHASFYTSGNGNKITGNPPLDIVGLTAGMTQMNTQVDGDGDPIQITGYVLVVPPALEVPANQLINAIEVRMSGDNVGTSDQLVIARNWIAGKLKVVVNPYIPIIGSGANANRMWFLFANPSVGNRPALAHGFLRGYQNPQMYMKDPNQIAIGGGPADVMQGNFDNDGIDFKIRHFFGCTRVDPKMTMASSGAGS